MQTIVKNYGNITLGNNEPIPEPDRFLEKITSNTLTTVTAEDFGNIEEIKSYLFYNNTNLTSVELPSTLKIIRYYAFNNTGLTNITLPEGLTRIEGGAFQSAYITNVTIPESVIYIEDDSFSSSAFTKENGGNYIGDILMSEVSGTTALTIKSGTRLIAAGACSYSDVTSVSFPSSIEIICKEAFKSSDITTITIPNVELGEEICAYCKSLTKATLSNGITKVPSSMFYNSTLETVIIPASVTDIGSYALSTSSLKQIYFRGSQTQWNAITKGSSWVSSSASYTMTYNYTGS